MINQHQRQKILQAQRNEITEYIIYRRLSLALKQEKNRSVLEKISREELEHYKFWESLTRQKVSPDRVKVFFYVAVCRIFGLTFGIKLMEKGENSAQGGYAGLRGISVQVDNIIQDESRHEQELIGIIDEERLKYIGSVVLGLNDALVELTGALAGFTLALQKARLVGVVGLITGMAASMSMAASEYLSTKQEKTEKNPLKASIYTGVAYVFTVLFLVFPYFIFNNLFLCLGLMIINALLVVFVFTYYISVARDLWFKQRFWEMAGISLTVAAISFFIGLIIRKVFGVEA